MKALLRLQIIVMSRQTIPSHYKLTGVSSNPSPRQSVFPGRPQSQTIDPADFNSGRTLSNPRPRTLFGRRAQSKEAGKAQGLKQKDGDEGVMTAKTQSIGYDRFDSLKAVLKKFQDLKMSNNEELKSIVEQQLIAQVHRTHDPFKKIDLFLVQTLLLLGKIQVFAEGQEVADINNQVCFVLFGNVKLFNQDYKFVGQAGCIFGAESKLHGASVELRGRTTSEACLLLLPLKSFRQIRERMIKNNFKGEFEKLQTMVRLNFIQKHFPTGWKNSSK